MGKIREIDIFSVLLISTSPDRTKVKAALEAIIGQGLISTR
jgi:hypothetical protein